MRGRVWMGVGEGRGIWGYFQGRDDTLGTGKNSGKEVFFQQVKGGKETRK